MRVAFIQGGTVVNISEFDDGFDLSSFLVDPGVTLVAGEDAAIGYSWSEAEGFAAPAVPLEQRKERLSAAVNGKRDAVLAGGYQHNFGGSAGIRTLDTRNERDRMNWLILKGQVKDLIEAGQGDADITIRDAGNESFVTSANTTLTALSGMEQWGSAVLAHSWALKDEIEAAADAAALDAVDLEAGWPD